jgi:hypothetical protein
MAAVPLVSVLPGAISFSDDNVNPTYRGQILLADRTVHPAIIKDLDARQLANELLVGVLGRALGLPVPDVALGRASPEDLAAKRAPQLADASRIVFVSREMKVPNLARCIKASAANAGMLQTILDGLKDWPALGNLYAFDAWVANVDRHQGNLLFGGKHEIWLIDHGHCFSGPTWQASDLGPDNNYCHKLALWLTNFLSLEERRRYSRDVEGCVNSMAQVDIALATAESHIANFLSPGDVQAVEAFLRDRIANVPRHANAALRLPSLI